MSNCWLILFWKGWTGNTNSNCNNNKKQTNEQVGQTILQPRFMSLLSDSDLFLIVWSNWLKYIHLKKCFLGKLEEQAHWERPRCWGRLKAATEDEIVGWQHWLNGNEFELTLGDGEGQGRLGVLQSMVS